MQDLMTLAGRRVLVVEDEHLIAEATERGLRRAGATVVGPVPSLVQAAALLASGRAVDDAVLDINLGGENVFPLLDTLLARGVRCVFATGSDPASIPAAYRHLACCEKPVDPRRLVSALVEQAPPRRARDLTLEHLRDQLDQQLALASDGGHTLIAAKLCEALHVVDEAIGADAAA